MCLYTYRISPKPNLHEAHHIGDPIEMDDSYQIKGRPDTIYLNVDSIDICKTCVYIEDFNFPDDDDLKIRSHGYEKKLQVYYIHLNRQPLEGSSLLLSIRYK